MIACCIISGYDFDGGCIRKAVSSENIAVCMVAERRKAFCYPNASSPRATSNATMPRHIGQGVPPSEAGRDEDEEAFASSVEDDEQLTGKCWTSIF